MLKYRAKHGKIEAHDVLRETSKMVVLAPNSSANSLGRELKEGKRSEWQNWHDTWEDAHAFLLAGATAEVAALRMRLEQATGRLGNIKGMKPPLTDNEKGAAMKAKHLAAKLEALGYKQTEISEPDFNEDGLVQFSAGVHVQVPLDSEHDPCVVRETVDGKFVFDGPRRSLDDLVTDLRCALRDEAAEAA